MTSTKLSNPQSQGAQGDTKAEAKKQTIVLSRLPVGTNTNQIEDLLNQNKFKFEKVEKLDQDQASQIIGTSNRRLTQKQAEEAKNAQDIDHAIIHFKDKSDCKFSDPYFDLIFLKLVIKVAQSIIFEKTLKIAQKKLHMILKKQHGDYNAETSIYIGLLNPFCEESDIIEELNLILRDDRIKKEKETTVNRSKQGQGNLEDDKDKSAKPADTKNFIISCMVFIDPTTQRSKQFAFVDFSTKEAAQICLNAWHMKSMKKFPNRLNVTLYDAQYQKMTKAEREKSKDGKKAFTNLWVEKLPYAFQEKDVFELFSQYGLVQSVKVKKPQTNIRLQNINSMPCAAYVNFATEEQAQKAQEELNGKQILPGTNSLRVEFYQRANKFMGGLMGLSREELI